MWNWESYLTGVLSGITIGIPAAIFLVIKVFKIR